MAGADQIPGFVAPDPLSLVAGDVVRSNGTRDVRVLPNGNFIGVVNTNPQQIGIGSFPSSTSRTSGISYLFGSDDLGNTPRAFFREATIGSEQQLEFVGDSGIDYAGNVSYVANLRDPSNPQTSTRNSLWENETLLFVEGDQFVGGVLTGLYYSSAGGVYRSPAGETIWIVSYADTPLGESVGTALVRGTSSLDVLLQSGTTIPGLGPLQGGGLSNIEWSQHGTNYIVKVDVEPGFTSADEALVVNGSAVFTASGGLVREGQVIPEADGGLDGEQWTGFQFFDVTESGDTAFGAFTSGPDGQDTVVVVNGEVLYREGDVLDGVTLTGQPLGVGINDRGDVAITWNETLFINDKKIAGPGTLIDSDGDGVADAPIDGFALSLGGLEVTDLVAQGGGDELPVVYFPGEFNGTRDAYFRLVPEAAIGADYDDNDRVDAADYTVWRDNSGGPAASLLNDATGGTIDVDQYNAWVAGFGLGGAGAVPTAFAVPEPTGSSTLALAFAGVTAIRGGRSRSRVAVRAPKSS